MDSYTARFHWAYRQTPMDLSIPGDADVTAVSQALVEHMQGLVPDAGKRWESVLTFSPGQPTRFLVTADDEVVAGGRLLHDAALPVRA